VILPGRQLIRRILERGVARGEFRPLDMDHAVYCVMAPMIFLMMWRHSVGACAPTDFEMSPERFIDQQIDLLVDGLQTRAPGAAPSSPAA